MRQRGFGRPGRRILGGVPDAPPALQRANELLVIGEYSAAAAAFEDLASRAEGRGGPRAPWLYLQAGRARLAMDQADKALAHFKRGLSLMAGAERYGQFLRAGHRIVDELGAHGMSKEAKEVDEYLSATLPALPHGVERTAHHPSTLPPHCPSCGAPLRFDEAEWIDDLTVECPYCGSPVKSE
jgi:tetratricopeptide (TPR) repeat protein